MLWNIGIRDVVEYPNIEAETKEEAIQQALEWWSERAPNILWCYIQEEEE